jgi:hypothetical protein
MSEHPGDVGLAWAEMVFEMCMIRLCGKDLLVALVDTHNIH